MSPAELDSTSEVELLLFDVGGTLYGVDASQVLRIDRAGPDALRVDALGQLSRGLRALSFQSPEGEKQLTVDAVHGVRTVELGSLRRLPPAAYTLPFAIGVWLDGEKPVLLLDLSENLQAQGRQ
ncbi:MAG TPA: Frizzy aggregation protein FrzB [Myxococcaceae bacterium]|nr:Frizzy aggregation protein FrzB [Myxococcaceae bacterium]